MGRYSKPKREIVGFIRFGITKEEKEMFDFLSKYEERCKSDLARLYSVRYAKLKIGLMETLRKEGIK